MVTPEKLYAATDDGLDILALHYSEVREAARSKKPFKARPDERTPSTSVKLFKTKQGINVWKITDFGDEGRATDPIAVHMKETGLRYSQTGGEAGPSRRTDLLGNRPRVYKGGVPGHGTACHPRTSEGTPLVPG